MYKCHSFNFSDFCTGVPVFYWFSHEFFVSSRTSISRTSVYLHSVSIILFNLSNESCPFFNWWHLNIAHVLDILYVYYYLPFFFFSIWYIINNPSQLVRMNEWNICTVNKTKEEQTDEVIIYPRGAFRLLSVYRAIKRPAINLTR